VDECGHFQICLSCGRSKLINYFWEERRREKNGKEAISEIVKLFNKFQIHFIVANYNHN
jgi:hypothetical protein